MASALSCSVMYCKMMVISTLEEAVGSILLYPLGIRQKPLYTTLLNRLES